MTSTSPRQTSRERLEQAGYALIGLGDEALARARTLLDGRDELPDQMRARIDDMVRSLRSQADDAAQAFDDLAGRGRRVTGRVRGRPEVHEADRAADRAGTAVKRATSTARHSTGRAAQQAAQQARAAETSVSRAAGAAARATGAATDEVGKPDYRAMTKDELYQLATERDIEGRSAMSKAELITALRRR